MKATAAYQLHALWSRQPPWGALRENAAVTASETGCTTESVVGGEAQGNGGQKKLGSVHNHNCYFDFLGISADSLQACGFALLVMEEITPNEMAFWSLEIIYHSPQNGTALISQP